MIPDFTKTEWSEGPREKSERSADLWHTLAARLDATRIDETLGSAE